MVNVDFANPSLVLGVSLIGCSVGLLQLRNMESKMSRDPDIVVAAMISIVGGALIFQGWRLDPLLLLCQALTSSVAFYYAIDVLRMRSKGMDAPALPPPSSTSVSDLQSNDLQYMQQGSPQQQQQQSQQQSQQQFTYNQNGRPGPGPYLQPPTQTGQYPWADQQSQQSQPQAQDPARSQNSTNNNFRVLPSGMGSSFRPEEDDYSRGRRQQQQSPPSSDPYNETIRYDSSGNLLEGSESTPIMPQGQYTDNSGSNGSSGGFNQAYQQGLQLGYQAQSDREGQYSNGGGYYYPDAASGDGGGSSSSSSSSYSSDRGGRTSQRPGGDRYEQSGTPSYDTGNKRSNSQTSYPSSYPDAPQGEQQRAWPQQQQPQQPQWQQQAGNENGGFSGQGAASDPLAGTPASPQERSSGAVDAGSRGLQRPGGGISERVEDWE
ncbi:MAG: hypothetical protein WDW38_003026 [Sanguina aurantia]